MPECKDSLAIEGITQWIECQVPNQEVAGSNPATLIKTYEITICLNTDPLQGGIMIKAPDNIEEWPTIKLLVSALFQANAPEGMIIRAKAGHYHDFLSDATSPSHLLMRDASDWGLPSIMDGVRDGDFDATKQEADWWGLTEDGMRTIAQAGGN